MLSEELKEVLKLSGGKIILSEGELKDSHVVMKLDEYLKEVTPVKKSQETEAPKLSENTQKKKIDNIIPARDSLTSEELLDRINADIALLKQRNAEKTLEEEFLDESDELDYDYIK